MDYTQIIYFGYNPSLMKVLVIKTSSMGDVLHTFPALSDALEAIPNLTFHWVVEENFAELPKWHRGVSKVIPVAVRRWRKSIFSSKTRKEFSQFVRQLREENYDAVIDAQGLLKSAALSLFAKGLTQGLDKTSAREGLASLFYHRRHKVARQQHAVLRLRQLFAAALGYTLPNTVANYGIDLDKLPELDFILPKNYLLCLHGTTWETKHYPEAYWIELLAELSKRGQAVVLPWGSAAEKARAEKFAADNPLITVLPKCNLTQVAKVLGGARAVISVDTGLSHLSAALHKPTIALYGPTNPALTGTEGPNQIHLAATAPPCAPCLQRVCNYSGSRVQYPACFDSINPARILQTLDEIIP